MKTRKLTALLLTSSLLLSMGTACGKKANTTSNLRTRTAERPQNQTAIFDLVNNGAGKNGTMTEEELRKAYSEFVFGVMKRCLAAAKGDNVLISSDSILFALEMCAAGASGDTLDQMLQTMVPGASNEEGFQFAVERMKSLKNEQLRIANSAWINDSLKASVYEDYLSYVKRHFNAQVSNIKFDSSAVKTINKWVSDKTDGMIENLIDNISSESLMVLVNAITFDAKWANPFDESDVMDLVFHSGDGSRKSTPFLCGGDDGTYLYNENAQGFLKYYEGGKYAFMTILPNDEEVDINTFMQEMTTEEYWKFWESRTTEYNLYFQFPEFETDYSQELQNYLADMGMKDAFHSVKADFSNMTDIGVFISRVIHKTHIEVNRSGTRAAAATAIDMKCMAAMEPEEIKSVICDRPFAYAIVDVESGLPVFLGTLETI